MKRLSLLIVLALTATANAAPFDVTDGWFRALPGTLPAGGYFTARNNSTREIAITGARSQACGSLMMHQSRSSGGLSGMTMVDKVVVPAGGTVRFAPGGYHLMCTGPKMKIGTRVPVLLNLSNSSAVAVAFTVRGATGK